ncbi:hypothetical protein [Geodermatophilus sp. URMC 62]|uniref:hypothetical protein n=1 Tax=Geodermatophilus sp. URMC 62 TaxID=3423414 RepID=UPI00406C9C7A
MRPRPAPALALVAAVTVLLALLPGALGERADTSRVERHAAEQRHAPSLPLGPAGLSLEAGVRQENATRLAASLRLVNYYPSGSPWERMWTEWSASTLDRDLRRVAGTGATTVRLIVFPSAFGFPVVRPQMRERLEDALRIAARHGLRVQLTLFDSWSDWADLAGSRTWTTSLLSGSAEDERIALVEVRNEIDPSDPQVTAWARDQVSLLHDLLPATPVTVSTSGRLGVDGLTTLRRALADAPPDLFSLHYYGDPGLAHGAFRRAAVAVAPTPLVVGEAGLSSRPEGPGSPGRAQDEADQAAWYRVVQNAARAAGLAPVAPWTLYDFRRGGVPEQLPDAEVGFGLLRTDGTPKPALDVVSAAFAGTLDAQPFNGRFTLLVGDGDAAAGWTPWKPTGSARIARGQGVSGDNALVFSGTRAQADGVTSWFTVPAQPVEPGQRWTVSVQARGTDATGDNDVTLSWFDGDGHWLANTSSPPLATGRPSWQWLIGTGSPPAGAEAVQLHLRSSANTGSVTFSRVSWKVTGG